MKKVCVLTALLMMPACAWGTVIVSAVDASTGLDTMGPLTVGQSFDVRIVVEWEQETMTGLSTWLSDTSYGSGPAAFAVTGYTLDSAYFSDSNVGGGWETGNGDLDGTEVWDLGAYDTTLTGIAGPQTDTICTVTLLTTTAYDPSMSYTLCPTDSGEGIPGGWLNFNESYEIQPFDETNCLTITPEPASALLLLAALPFVRRRRAG